MTQSAEVIRTPADGRHLSMDQRLYDQPAFSGIFGQIAEDAGLQTPQLYHLARQASHNLTSALMHHPEFGQSENPLDCFALIRESPDEVFSKLKSLVFPYRMIDNYMKQIMNSCGIDKDRTKSIIIQLINRLALSAPFWFLYFDENNPYYRIDGRPGLQVRNPTQTALTYDAWVTQQENKSAERNKRAGIIFELEVEADARSLGLATNPNMPAGERRGRRNWITLKNAEITREK